MPSDLTRRHFVSAAAAVLGAAAIGKAAASALPEEPTPVKVPPEPGKKIGLAIVGLGKLAIEQILPAFAKSERCRVTAFVTGHADKGKTLAARYGVDPKAIYSYENYEQIKNNPDIDAVYIVLPNALHAEYTVRAAQAGKHVLSEKPMATSSADCQKMIDACNAAGKKLMVAYRMQYEPFTNRAQAIIRDKTIGKSKLILAQNSQDQEPNTWRTDKALAGGGSLPDIGLYCLNTTRFLLQEEPLDVQAYIYSTPNDSRFRTVEELVSWTMRFPSGAVLSASCTYGAAQDRFYRVSGEQGYLSMDHAYDYQGLKLTAYPKAGSPNKESQPIVAGFSTANQFALEMDHFAEAILEGKPIKSPGEEGLRDQRLMEAIYRSAEGGQRVDLGGQTPLTGVR